MKKKLLIFLLLVLILCIVIGILLYKKNTKLEYKDTISINIGDKIPSINDYTNNDKVSKINWNNLNIEDNTCYYSGTYTGSFTYKKESHTVKLEVIDNKEPTIEIEDITTDYGKEVDIKSKVKTTDNSKDEITINIEGDYNFKKAGTYNLKVIAKDKSNNESTKDFKLIVKEKVVEKSSNNSSTITNNTTDKMGKTSKGFSIVKKNGVYYIGGILIANKTYSLPSNYNPGNLTKSFMEAYNKMKKEYDKQGFKSYPTLSIRSGFRSYSYQSSLYNNYVARDGKAAADRYSARPGHSEHQTGLAADLNVISNTYGDTDSGKWLANNCWKWGFILRYPKGKESKTGYMYESWHFRYLGDSDLAKKLYNNGSWLTLEEYLGITSKY